MAGTGINQKEYLKKYLSIGGEPGKKKKRKKKSTGVSDRVKIIDDDIDEAIFNQAVEDDLYGVNEDAPQIVGVIDDRPLELRIDDYRKSDKWKPVGTQNADEVPSTQVVKLTEKPRVIEDASKSDDNSPPRRRKQDSASPSRHKTGDNRTRKHSRSRDRTPRRVDDNSPPRRHKQDSRSPSRHRRGENGTRNHTPRRNERGNNDNSPERRYKNRWHDSSPTRTNKSYRNYGDSTKRYHREHSKEKYVRDFSPPRKYLKESPTQKPFTETATKYSERKLRDRPETTRRHDNDGFNKQHSKDFSPPRKDRNANIGSQAKEETPTPPRNTKKNNESVTPKRIKSRWDSGPAVQTTGDDSVSSLEAIDKATKTLDGRTAGLQKSDELVNETRVLKTREDEMFKNLSAEVSGMNATAIVRDRKTGKVRDFQKEAEDEKKRKEKEDENNEKYAKWGKGLKQVEEHTEKVSSELYEMTKPLARYADDEDLERHLKEQEREGDPMLAYIRKKKKKTQEIIGKPIKPQFEGEFMPNRYGIRPGHRWDGVDRSSGYETKWFEVINSRRAQQEEVYKWSTEDM